MIKMKSISKFYPNGARALYDINLNIHKGEFVFLVGQSGAGKSTLIKLLYRDEIPTRGQVIVDSDNLIRLKEREIPLLRRKIGVIFQDFKLLQNMTVFENIAFAQQVVGKPKKEIENNTEVLLEVVGLSKKRDVYPDEISGGEQQRVCVARALANNPPILVADEPTGNLDQDTAWEIMEILSRVNKMGTTIIMATHALYIVEKMKKRVVTIDKGKIIDDRPEGANRFGI
ncbi:MAG: cell division ATP-binding protein FtsE [Eubacteriales bacterium]